MNKFINFIKNIPSWGKVVLLVLAITGAFMLSLGALRSQFEKLSNKNTMALYRADAASMKLFKSHTNEQISETEKELLHRKLDVIREHKGAYLNLLSILYKNYYALLSLIPFLTGLTGLLVFIIMQNGWKSSSVYLKATFLVFAFLSALTGILPEVYQQKENINRFTDSYESYSIIQKSIYNYNLTAPYIDKDSLGFRDFILDINEKEKGLIDIHLGLERKEITKKIYEMNK